MKPASVTMKEKILKTNFIKPKYKIVNNVTANIEEEPNSIKDLLIKQIYSTVR